MNSSQLMAIHITLMKMVKLLPVFKNWGTIYYFGEDGIQVKDSLVTEDGYTYYITSKGYATKNQFADFEDGTRFFDSDGHMVVGTTITYWFVKYTFDENGILIK